MILFVLPLYQKMEKHLEVVSISWEHSFKMQHAVGQGLTKLRKYSTPEKLHHSYILWTVLHPYLWSLWFVATADLNDAAVQEEAITTAEVIFKYIAKTYLEMPTSPMPTAVPRPIAKAIVKTPSFLASACSFQQPITAATITLTLKRTPQEALADELTHYFNFEAMPGEQQDGEERSSDDPSAQEVLLNPLLWWKVSTLFKCL
ncbi:hypothetical protein L208DRAFT_1375355 [Tricholoma matsutake]|nr:hypothetical protein L208DRAFT_1375355 [Tricholoma matsutake 945]